MKKFIFIAVFVLLVPLSVLSQTLTPEQIANQRLAKAMDVIETQDKYIAALEGQVKALEAAGKAKDDLNTILTHQRDQFAKMKCQKTSIFFVYRTTRCY